MYYVPTSSLFEQIEIHPGECASFENENHRKAFLYDSKGVIFNSNEETVYVPYMPFLKIENHKLR